MASKESGLMFWPPRRDARPEPAMGNPLEAKLLEVIFGGCLSRGPPVSNAQKKDVKSIDKKTTVEEAKKKC